MAAGDWIFLGAGTYNIVYKSKDGKEVLKNQINSVAITDHPERSVRLWNEINSHVPPPARVVVTEEFGKGWICPFIEGVQASDAQIAQALIDIYSKTGRIVMDATARQNFLTTPSGQVVCVDVGLALQLELTENSYLADVRRNSVVSRAAWSNLNRGGLKGFLTESMPYYPLTVQVGYVDL